jgi:hypothetical protein
VVVPRDDDDESDPSDTLECAPTDTNGPVQRRGNIAPSIDKWCESLNQGTVTKDDNRKEQVWSYGSPVSGSKHKDLVFSANWVSDVKGEGCPDRTRGLEPDHCKKAMFEILDTCGGKDGKEDGLPRYGGSQQGDYQCVIWKIEIIDQGTFEGF